MINLTQSRAVETPSEIFQGLARSAAELQVTASDVYGDFSASPEASSLRQFELEVAQFLHKDDAMFLPSGGMAGNIVLSIAKAAAGNNRLLCHYSSHMLIHEQSAWKELIGMEAIIIPADPSAVVQEPVTFASFSAALASAAAPPAVVVIECPHREIGGKLTPIEDLVRISELCRERGIHLHMDGARLWEASAAYTLADVCPLFDTIYVSMYKGLGAVTGAMLLGSSAVIAESRVWLRRFGGNLFSLLPYYASSWAGFRAHKDAFVARHDRLQEVIKEVNLALKQEQMEDEALIWFDPPVPQVSLIHVYLRADLSVVNKALENVANQWGVRVIARVRAGQLGAAGQVYSEFNMGPANMSIPTKDWVRGYVHLQRELRALIAAAQGQDPRHPVYAEEVIDFPVEDLWALFRPYNGLPKITGGAIATSVIEVDNGNNGDSLGSIRYMVTGDGGFVRELLLVLDDAKHLITYQIIEGSPPFGDYVASVRFTPITAGQTRCEWWADFLVIQPGEPSLACVTAETVATTRSNLGEGLFRKTFHLVRDMLAAAK